MDMRLRSLHLQACNFTVNIIYINNFMPLNVDSEIAFKSTESATISNTLA